jgi:signal transduction histidine kinase
MAAPRETDTQTNAMLRMLLWLIRLAAAVFIGVLTFGYSPPAGRDLVIEAIAFAIGVAVVACWVATDLRRPAGPPPRGLDGALVLMAAVTGLGSAFAHGGALIGFAALAVVGTGAGSSLLAGWVTTASGILAVEIGALITTGSHADALQYPLLLIVAFVLGRNRAAYRTQAEQSAAMVTQLERLQAEQQQVAALNERTRIAREIHDVLAHSLGALGIQLQAARAVLAEDGDLERGLSLLDRAQRMATDGLAETRQAVHALRSDTTGLDEGVAGLVETHRAQHRADVSYRVEGEPRPLPPEATVALIRTAQEALVNTAKHAPHQPVDVGLRYGEDGVQMIISNQLPADGPDALPGPPVVGTADGGYGLTGMHERLRLIRGTLTAASDGTRWTVTARVPR